MKWYILTVNLLLLNISGKKDKMNALSGYFTMNKIFLYIGLFIDFIFSQKQDIFNQFRIVSQKECRFGQ